MVRASNSGLGFYRILQSSFAKTTHDGNMFSPSLRSNSEQFIRKVESIATDCRILVTSKGFVGLGPNRVQDGDEIVVLAGAFIPRILYKDQDGFYQFVANFIFMGLWMASL